MLVLANLAYTKGCKNPENDLNPGMWYTSSESTQQELSNEYKHSRVFVLWMKVALALEGLKNRSQFYSNIANQELVWQAIMPVTNQLEATVWFSHSIC